MKKRIKIIVIFILLIISIIFIKTNSYAKYMIIQNLKVAEINIDKLPPKVTVNYQEVEDKVIVEIVSNEKVKQIQGWKLENNSKTLIKEYNKNINEKVEISDIYGNILIVDIAFPKVQE